MQFFLNYPKKGLWVMVLGFLVGGGSLVLIEAQRAAAQKHAHRPQVEYIGEASQSEPRTRAPSSLPASPR